MLIKKVPVGPWETNLCEAEVRMARDEETALVRLLEKWNDVFPCSHNLAERAFGLKSAIVRFDYVFRDGCVYVYEIEERPAGLGHTALIHPTFLRALRVRVDDIEDALGRRFAIYMSPLRDGTSDDDVISGLLHRPIFRRLDEKGANMFAWYVRAMRHEEGIDRMLGRNSLSTIRTEGCKSYGVSLGWWEEVLPDFTPDWNEGFVMKPRAGSRFEEVLLWHPDKSLGSGFATKSKILNSIQEGRVRYAQPFIPPETVLLEGKVMRSMRRAFFVWSPSNDRYESLGGTWVATTGHRIHGTRDAIWGSLLPAA